MPVIHSRTPLRISVAGGGIDMPEYYRHGTTCVAALAVDLFVRVAVSDSPEAARAVLPPHAAHRLDPTEATTRPYVMAARRVLGLRHTPHVAAASDVLPGSGLGGSGYFSVALRDALSRYEGHELDNERLARLAYRIERGELRRTVGQQGGWVAAIGGAARMVFRPDGSFEADTDEALFVGLDRLLPTGLLLRVGRQRDAGHVLARTRRITPEDFADAAAGARLLHSAFASGDLRRIGRALRERWAAKVHRNPAADRPVCRRLADADTPDSIYGFKLVGAGGGGHLLVAAEAERHTETLRFLERLGLTRIPVRAWQFGLERTPVPTACPPVPLRAPD